MPRRVRRYNSAGFEYLTGSDSISHHPFQLSLSSSVAALEAAWGKVLGTAGAAGAGDPDDAAASSEMPLWVLCLFDDLVAMAMFDICRCAAGN